MERARVPLLQGRESGGFPVEGRWADCSTTPATARPRRPLEWLRIHKALTKVWFLQTGKAQEYRWDGDRPSYPATDYFQEDCESSKLGFVVRSRAGATGTV